MRDALHARLLAVLAWVAALRDTIVEMSDWQWAYARNYARQEGFVRGTRGQTNLVGLFIGLLIAGIVAVEVFIPVMNDAVNNSNASGNTKTILELLGLFAALLLLVALAGPLMRRV